MIDDEKYGPDWVPSPAEAAYADQQLAALRKRVDALVAHAAGIEFPNRPLPILLGEEACNEVVAQADGNDEREFPIAIGMLGITIAEAAALRQQLDEARAERDRFAKSLDEAVDHLADEESARGDTESALTAARRSIENLRERMIAAEADRDRLLVVYRAAEAWAEVGRTRTSQTGNSSIWLHEYGNRRDALIAAVDSYRSAAPAEPAPGGGE